jgi:hypothetical protein
LVAASIPTTYTQNIAVACIVFSYIMVADGADAACSTQIFPSLPRILE